MGLRRPASLLPPPLVRYLWMNGNVAVATIEEQEEEKRDRWNASIRFQLHHCTAAHAGSATVGQGTVYLSC